MNVTITRPALTTTGKIMIVVGWALLIGLLLRTFMPDNPLRPSKAVKETLTAVAPQGWVFFTRDPREPSDRVFRKTAPCCEVAIHPNGHASNLFGIQRTSRAQGIELGSLIAQAPASAWVKCRGDLASCLARTTTPPKRVWNRSTVRSLCGAIIVQRHAPIPWAWSRGKNPSPPYDLLSMDVSCE